MRLLLVMLLAAAGCGDDGFDVDGGDPVTLGAAYAAHRQCAMCHQAPDGTLSGQTTPAPGTMAYGSNLTSDADTGLGGWADVEIIRAMRFGYDHRDQPLCPPMTHLTNPNDPTSITGFDDMDDLEAHALVAWLRSLAPVSRTIPASQCPPLKPPPAVDMAVPVSLDLALPPPPDDLSSAD